MATVHVSNEIGTNFDEACLSRMTLSVSRLVWWYIGDEQNEDETPSAGPLRALVSLTAQTSLTLVDSSLERQHQGRPSSAVE